MTDHKNENAFGEDWRADDMDQVLDAALANYSAVEPRPGLEGRILTNLRTEQEHAPNASWWRWGLAVTITTLVIVAVSLAWRSKAAHPQIANHPPSTTQSPAKPAVAPDGSARNTPPREIKPVRRAPSPELAAAVVAEGPKLDQFPSRQPVSPEEIALAQYVLNFPKEAQLVAKSQREFELETQKEMTDAGSEIRSSGSIQQER